jgi:DNA-binding LytR/AlgR family response regulator
VRVSKSMQKVFVDQIVYVESCKDYVKIFLTTGQNFIARQSISSMENMLSAHSFLRVHRSFLISLEKMTGYNNNDVLIGQTEIPIGRLYKQQVMEVIGTG